MPDELSNPKIDELATKDIDELFRVSVQVFDWSVDRKLDIYKVIMDPAFIELYRRLGHPEWTEYYIAVRPDSPRAQKPITLQTPPQIVSEVKDNLARLSTMPVEDKSQLDAVIFEKALGLRSWYLNLYCSEVLGTSVESLIESAQSGDKDAFVQLIEVDSLFLTSEFAKKLIREAELSRDLDFKGRIANAMNPFRKPRATKRQRQAFAVHLIKLFGPHRRSYPEWVEFLDTLGFDLKGSRALAKACERADISKRNTDKS
jgi:hypothetical protein